MLGRLCEENAVSVTASTTETSTRSVEAGVPEQVWAATSLRSTGLCRGCVPLKYQASRLNARVTGITLQVAQQRAGHGGKSGTLKNLRFGEDGRKCDFQ